MRCENFAQRQIRCEASAIWWFPPVENILTLPTDNAGWLASEMRWKAAGGCQTPVMSVLDGITVWRVGCGLTQRL